MNEIVESIVNKIDELFIRHYIELDLAKDLVVKIRTQAEHGSYNTLDLDKLTVILTKDLQSITKDKHVRVRRKAVNELSQQLTPEAARKVNNGFYKAEILDDNIGYIDFRLFYPTAWAAETGAAAMKFIANTDALIIDLRKNGGGDPEMVAFMCSYFFEERTHLNDLYCREQDSTEQFWTVYVPGPLYVDKPLYILTSSYTFSGAEEFSYNLKNLNRARIIGETTKGGANPGSWHVLPEGLEIFVPIAKSINPITKDNWEGKGVVPHVKILADKALTVALKEIRAKLIEKKEV
ncbi:S41 family peptidase [Neobacillus sp. NPDC097160]|uniref:S41 family peptidase n=1 Tax=Neobacillus sp. NPDC097160 TaxID=3364298 RepID=UPI00380DA215